MICKEYLPQKPWTPDDPDGGIFTAPAGAGDGLRASIDLG